MTDRPQSIPPTQHAFRETFLWRFPSETIADAFRVAGDALIDALNEAGSWGPKSACPLTYGEVQGACEDLSHLVRHLEEIGDERSGSDLDAVSETLSAAAEGWASRLAHLVLDMRQSLDEALQAARLGDREEAELEDC